MTTQYITKYGIAFSAIVMGLIASHPDSVAARQNSVSYSLKPDADEEVVSICILNPDTKAGLRKLNVLPLLARVLHKQGKAPLVQSAENCDTDFDDNCDGEVNEGCPLCGDGKAQGMEECDDGPLNGSQGHACTSKCTLDPAPGVRFAYQDAAGDDCAQCMNTRCTSYVRECGVSTECVEASRCPVDKKCINSSSGAMNCLCPEQATTTNCKAAGSGGDEFEGACTGDVMARLGAPDFTTPFWVSGKASPVQKAYSMHLCLNFACRDSCHEIIEDINPVCGNGVVEAGEECDDSNRIDTDDCDNECKLANDEELKEFEFLQRTGKTCEFCMRSSCSQVMLDCLDTAGCVEASQCQAQHACLDPFVGPLDCICGDLSVPECLDAAYEPVTGEARDVNALPGPCTIEIARNTGATNTRKLFQRLADRGTVGGLANQVYVCMGRFCQESCYEMFKEQ